MISEHQRVSQCKMAALQYLGKRAEKAVFDWKWISRPLEIFSLLLMHLCKRMGNFCLSLDSRQSLAGKQNTTQLLSRDSSSYSVGTFGVYRGEQCWDSIASMALLVSLTRCLSASGLRQLLDKQFVLSLRALPCHASTWTEAQPCWETATELGLMAKSQNFKAAAIKKLALNKSAKVKQGCSSDFLVGKWVYWEQGTSNFNGWSLFKFSSPISFFQFNRIRTDV